VGRKNGPHPLRSTGHFGGLGPAQLAITVDTTATDFAQLVAGIEWSGGDEVRVVRVRAGRQRTRRVCAPTLLDLPSPVTLRDETSPPSRLRCCAMTTA
jgi:hypothetical protein